MPESPFTRQLSAIFSADVQGYSRLMEANEDATVKTLLRYRELMTRLIQQHRGRVIDSPGDNLLAAFHSVLDAVSCGWAIQQEIEQQNASLPRERRMHLRIGINLGDVIEEAGRIYGDGINVAARLESLAPAGGICIAGPVYDQVKNKLPYRFEDRGRQRLKNIDTPVRVYHVITGASQTTHQEQASAKPARKVSLFKVLAVLAAGAALVAGFAFWAHLHVRALNNREPISSAMHPAAAKASIAVMPLKNLSDDAEQEYFSDGITTDIITDLSKFSHLLVISGNTTFTYKGQSVDAQTIGNELKVGYVLEGSVQKAGTSVRVNARLVDAENGTQLWAERFEHDFDDIFTLQGEIVQAIVASLAIKTFKTEQARAKRKKPQDLQAYDYLLRGWDYFNQRTRASNLKARQMFEKAATLDPDYAEAYVGMGLVAEDKVSYGWTQFPDQVLAEAFANARRALQLDESQASAHTLLAGIYAYRNRYDLAISEAERAIALNPNDARGFHHYGYVLLWSGRIEEAIAALKMSLRLDRHTFGNTWMHLGFAYYLQKRYPEALKVLANGVLSRPEFPGNHIALAATYARLGRKAEAAQEAAIVRRLDPFFEVDSYGTAFRDPTHHKAIVEGLRMAGL